MKRDEAVLNAVVVEVEPTLFLPFASRDDASEAVVLLVLGYGVERLRGRELDRAGKVVWEVVLEPLVIPLHVDAHRRAEIPYVGAGVEEGAKHLFAEFGGLVVVQVAEVPVVRIWFTHPVGKQVFT